MTATQQVRQTDEARRLMLSDRLCLWCVVAAAADGLVVFEVLPQYCKTFCAQDLPTERLAREIWTCHLVTGLDLWRARLLVLQLGYADAVDAGTA